MPAIIGLGNPGKKYAGTRHNVGFKLVDQLAAAQSIKLGPGKGPFDVGTRRYQGDNIILIKPTTYMNLSGDAVQQALHWFKIDPKDCLVCYDDLDIEIGAIRLRANGSAGGHNGIKDIIQKLGTKSFPRLRIGIGNEFPKGQQVNYVLSKFDKKEQEKIDQALADAEDAIHCYLREGIDKAMNKFN